LCKSQIAGPRTDLGLGICMEQAFRLLDQRIATVWLLKSTTVSERTARFNFLVSRPPLTIPGAALGMTENVVRIEFGLDLLEAL
jgi:hypothetical protein